MTKKVIASAADLTFWHVAVANGLPPLAAIRIAQLSGRADPWIVGLPTLTLPDSPGPDTGGLPAPGTTP